MADVRRRYLASPTISSACSTTHPNSGSRCVDELDAPLGEAVVDTWRDDRLRVAVDDAVGLERPQGLREHLLADALGPPTQLAPSLRTVGERHEDEDAPLARDVVEDDAARARGSEHLTRSPVRATATAAFSDPQTTDLVTYPHVRTLLQSAYPPRGRVQ